MFYKPAPEFILVRQDIVADRTAGGIFKPDMAKEDTLRGTVVGLGSQTQGYALGDRLIWGKYAGTPMDARGSEFAGTIQLRKQDVLGFLDVPLNSEGACSLQAESEGAEKETK